jgi:murein DD-endopeptidase MepM/ murein hydrolase activator NlpD
MRGPDKNVRQFNVSKRSMVAAPAAAILAVSGCFAGFQLRAVHQIDELESRLSAQTYAYRQAAQLKDKQAVSLEREIGQLTRQTSEMKTKLEDLRELEAKLQGLVDKYGTPSDFTHSSSKASDNKSGVTTAGGSASSLGARGGSELEDMLSGSDPDFRGMSAMLDHMETSMAESLRRTNLRKAELAAMPSGWPTVSRIMTSGFGYRTDPFTGHSTFHAGVDISGEIGDPVFAAADGTVLEADFDSGKGNYVLIGHLNGLKTYYMHLKRTEAKKGESVVRGEKIGYLGSTGRSTGPHLHFEVVLRDVPVNPLKYLRLVKED